MEIVPLIYANQKLHRTAAGPVGSHPNSMLDRGHGVQLSDPQLKAGA
jgi:hypothetical protein